jgi:hypothetical protein
MPIWAPWGSSSGSSSVRGVFRALVCRDDCALVCRDDRASVWREVRPVAGWAVCASVWREVRPVAGWAACWAVCASVWPRVRPFVVLEAIPKLGTTIPKLGTTIPKLGTTWRAAEPRRLGLWLIPAVIANSRARRHRSAASRARPPRARCHPEHGHPAQRGHPRRSATQGAAPPRPRAEHRRGATG